MQYNLDTPLDKEVLRKLRAGDRVEINGAVYAARDAAHKNMAAMLEEGRELPFDIKGQVIYYVGPCPAKPGKVIGSAGPTTSGRMDVYTPVLVEKGLAGMIGKGLRSRDVIEAMIKHGAIYFGAIGGAGALIAKHVVSQEIIAFPELGPEALRKLHVVGFPVVVLIDSHGNNLYEIGKKKYRQVYTLNL
ncbi:MAG: Fe-S-containing hydro-lyase [Clostridiaceae bacterium]|nr:Fe-S-containing hydro-lyase [Clostridiaceae bacterium]